MPQTVKQGDNYIVLRGGTISSTGTKNSTDGKNQEPVDTQDKLLGLSVQVWTKSKASFTDPEMRKELTGPIPNNTYTLTRSDCILRKGGTITFKALPGNPYHAEVSGITLQDLVDCFSKEGMPYDK